LIRSAEGLRLGVNAGDQGTAPDFEETPHA